MVSAVMDGENQMVDGRSVLLAALRDCARLLTRAQEGFWSEKIDRMAVTDAEQVNSEIVSDILSWFGGMGSFNDLLISQANGHQILPDDEDRANGDLETLRNQIYEAATELHMRSI